MAEERSRSWIWIVVGVFVLFLVAFGAIVLLGVLSLRDVGNGRDTVEVHDSSDKIAVVDLEGLILTSKDFLDHLNRYENDDSVKAIVIRVNSPGGGAAASQEMYSEIERLKQEHKKPIVTSIETVGASGAYYIASATDKIYADRASVVGSIGVIAEWVNYGDLMRWAKLQPIVLQAGALKDAGDPSRPMTPEERAYLQGLVDDMYTQFVHDVSQGRHQPENTIRGLASGRVWTGEQALSLKLIDGVAGYRQVLEQVGQQVGLGKNPSLIYPAKHHRSVFDLVFGDATDLFPMPNQAMRTDIGFYYLWR